MDYSRFVDLADLRENVIYSGGLPKGKVGKKLFSGDAFSFFTDEQC